MHIDFISINLFLPFYHYCYVRLVPARLLADLNNKFITHQSRSKIMN